MLLCDNGTATSTFAYKARFRLKEILPSCKSMRLTNFDL